MANSDPLAKIHFSEICYEGFQQKLQIVSELSGNIAR